MYCVHDQHETRSEWFCIILTSSHWLATISPQEFGLVHSMQAPELFTVSPSLAIPKALARAGIDKSDVDFFEINEAFAVSCDARTYPFIVLSKQF